MRKSEAARREWTPELVRGCALRQTAILEHAASLVRVGGRLAYATCTFNPEENEETIARFLDSHPEFELIELSRSPGFSPGVWHQNDVYDISARVVRLWPHLAPGEGHFVAVLRRTDAVAAPPVKLWQPAKLPKAIVQAYHAFCAANLRKMAADDQLALVGTYLYALPAGLPDLTGLRHLHPGWWLGTVKGERFEPSHALALGLTLQDAQRTLDLPPDASELAAYLRGESLSSPGEDGWLLVATSGYPIGWAKRSRERLRSYYPKGLRWP